MAEHADESMVEPSTGSVAIVGPGLDSEPIKETTSLGSSTAAALNIPPIDSTAPSPLILPHKPRSDSLLQSSRPAPPSPASSRRSSQVLSLSPNLSSASGFRDRAGSTSSSRSRGGGGGRRTSTGGSPGVGLTQSQLEKNIRRRSNLGQNVSTAERSESDGLYGNSDGGLFSGSNPASGSGSGNTSATGSGVPSGLPSGIASPSQPPTPASIPENDVLLTTGTGTATGTGAGSATSDTTPTLSSTEPPSGSQTHTSPAAAVVAIDTAGIAVTIRDYAFPASDERFHGHGELQTSPVKSKWRFSGIGGGGSPRQSSSESGGAGKTWGFGLLGGWRNFAAGGSASASSKKRSSVGGTSDGGQSTGSGTSAGTGVKIYNEPDETSSAGDSDGEGVGVGAGRGESAIMEDDEDYFSDDDDDDDGPRPDGVRSGGRADGDGEMDEEPWGLYRAAYTFEAEGEHEIGLEEGDVVDVRGRGGGEGWVIALKDGREGLVPESYLESIGLATAIAAPTATEGAIHREEEGKEEPGTGSENALTVTLHTTKP